MLQCLYALLLAYYSFFVIWQSQGADAYQNIFMNATALLFLNDISSYVCLAMKSFIQAKDEPLFLVVKQIESKKEGIIFDPQTVFDNFYPKIYAITSVFYSLGMIANSYVAYPDAVEVPKYFDAFLEQLIALLALFVGSAVLFVLLLAPLSCSDKIGEGFTTFDYEEVMDKGIEEHQKERQKFNHEVI